MLANTLQTNLVRSFAEEVTKTKGKDVGNKQVEYNGEAVAAPVTVNPDCGYITVYTGVNVNTAIGVGTLLIIRKEGKYIVRYLQTTLNNVYKCNLIVDVIYGKATKYAVKKHYLKIGCKGDNVVWP